MIQWKLTPSFASRRIDVRSSRASVCRVAAPGDEKGSGVHWGPMGYWGSLLPPPKMFPSLRGHALVSKFLGFEVSWCHGFKVSKIYRVSNSCFLEDTDPISKIPKTFKTDLHHVSESVVSNISKRKVIH